ncbi:site-specific integrase [Salinisphaera japonica]|uniref:site-specific integrase n=1 Tax=Salinisphaera japonica TaxID=1304270 RepID=UPI0016211EE0|nr:site-specific integrase [Salinisphaera japonica]
MWTALDGAALQGSTLSEYLRAIESLYLAVERQTGKDCLDKLIAELDFDDLEKALEGHFVYQRNHATQTFQPSQGWRLAVGFVSTCVSRLAKSSDRTLDSIHHRLLRLDQLYTSLQMPRSKRSETVRALPAAVVEDLYDVLTPGSTRNPFRTKSLQWRNFSIILLMLHQGLRRSEVLALPADAIKQEWVSNKQLPRCWLDIAANPYERVDPRADPARLKNHYATRQIPASSDLAGLIETYRTSYRGKPSHSYLFTSQTGAPLSKRSINVICSTLSSSLKPSAVTELKRLRKIAYIRPHDFRHTCAVMRLRQFVDAGTDMDMALQKLRVLFGWSRTSTMPQRYARAYFEERLATVWQDAFEVHVDALRRLEGVSNQ